MQRDSGSFSIPSSYSRIVARELGLQERELPRLLWGTGLPVSALLPGDESLLTGQQQIQVLVNARQISGVDHIGLRIGQQLQPADDFFDFLLQPPAVTGFQFLLHALHRGHVAVNNGVMVAGQ